MLPDGDILADASFLLALLDRLPGAVRFKDVLKRSRLTAPNLGEVIYKLRERLNVPPESTARFLRSQGVRVEPFDPASAMHFAELKDIDARSRATQEAEAVGSVRQLSLADMCCLGHAIDHALPVLTGDRHWLTLARHGLTVDVYDFRNPALTI